MRRAFFFIVAIAFATTSFASIPRASVLDDAPPIADVLSETRIRVSEVLASFERPAESELTRALRQAYDDAGTTNASGLRRFLSVDPVFDLEEAVHEPQMWNRYAYVTNNPLQYTDPDGRYRTFYKEKPMTRENLCCAPRSVSWAFYAQGALLALAAGGPVVSGIRTGWQALVGVVLTRPQAVRQVVDAVASPPGSSALPSLPTLSGTVREMATEAISFTAAMRGSAAQKVEAFSQLAGQIEKSSGGAWSATQIAGTNGATVFFGRAGEALVIAANGQVFRGRLNEGIRVVKGVAEVDWGKVKLVR